MKLAQLYEWDDGYYHYVGSMTELLIFNRKGIRVAGWFVTLPPNIEYHFEYAVTHTELFHCLVNTLPEDLKARAGTEIVGPWKDCVMARLRECYA